VPGGYGARRAVDDASFIQWLIRASATATTLFAVGSGALPLAKAGLLGDADVAIATDSVEALRELSPTSRPDTRARFRESGRIVSATVASGALEAALHLVARAIGNKQAAAVAASLGAPWTATDTTTVSILDPDD
jgi:transcriptional regulator GlxA family with amidase domain